MIGVTFSLFLIKEKIGKILHAIKVIDSESVYIPDVYHLILHILIIIALVTTICYHTGRRNQTTK